MFGAGWHARCTKLFDARANKPGKRTVTFTRTEDVDVNSLPDPASQPPRVASPAQGLYGRYHDSTTGFTEEYDFVVRTDCLRTGDRCMRFFHAPDGFKPLVFDGVKWIDDSEGDSPCLTGGTVHTKISAEFPPPQAPQDPITLLTGHGHIESTGTACTGGDFDDKLLRIGD